MPREWTRDDYTISTDPKRLDLGLVHGFLTTSYWAKGRSRERVAKSIEQSLCFGLYHGNEQLGFARVLTDYVTHAYLADVFVLEAYRGKGLGVWLVEVVTSFPELSSIRRWHLLTKDAHALYRKFGFVDVDLSKHMERVNVHSDK